MATAAAAAGVMNPSLLAASFHAANFTIPNNTESQNEMGNIMERDSSARSSVLLLPPYMSSFTQVSGLIIEYQLKRFSKLSLNILHVLMKLQRHHSSPDHHSFPNMISPSNGMHTQNALGSNQNPFSLSPGVVVDAEKRKRNRTFIDPVSEVPRLEEWFILNTHPSHALIARYTDELNRLPYRQKVN